MRDDLLDARAGITWAETQIDVLRERLVAWNQDTPYRWTEEIDPQTGDKVIRLSDVKLPPPIINAEVGFIIHALRSSLDVLINRLAERNGHVAPKNAHMPICRDFAAFTTGKHAGRKAIKRLSVADQAVIEHLEPWAGGNNPMLVALHDLDIQRKHRRLIAVIVKPTWVMAHSTSAGVPIRFHRVGDAIFENDAVVARIPIGDYTSKAQLALDVSFSKGSGIVEGGEVSIVLTNLARLANSIIDLFDAP